MEEKSNNSKVLHGFVIEGVDQEKECLYAEMKDGRKVTCYFKNHASLHFDAYGQPSWEFRPISTDLPSVKIGEKIRAECMDDWANFWVFEYEIALQKGSEFFGGFLKGTMLNDGKRVKVDGRRDESRYYHFIPENRVSLRQNEDGEIEMPPAEPTTIGCLSEIKFIPEYIPGIGQGTLHWIPEAEFCAFVKAWRNFKYIHR